MMHRKVQQVIDDQIERGLDLGSLHSVQIMPQGQISETLAFTTVNRAGGFSHYVISYPFGAREERSMTVKHALERVLFARGAPIAEPVAADRTSVGDVYSISEFVDGTQFQMTDISVHRVTALGRALARFHIATMDLPGTSFRVTKLRGDRRGLLRHHATALFKVVQCFGAAGERLPIAEASKAARLFLTRQVTKRIATQPQLPQGFLHGDLHASNIVFGGPDEMEPKLLDLGAFYHGDLIDDVADALIKACADMTPDGPIFSREKAAAMLKGYNTVRRLSPDEMSALPSRMFERSFRIKAVRGAANFARGAVPSAYRTTNYPDQIIREIRAFAKACSQPDWLVRA